MFCGGENELDELGRDLCMETRDPTSEESIQNPGWWQLVEDGDSLVGVSRVDGDSRDFGGLTGAFAEQTFGDFVR